MSSSHRQADQTTLPDPIQLLTRQITSFITTTPPATDHSQRFSPSDSTGTAPVALSPPGKVPSSREGITATVALTRSAKAKARSDPAIIATASNAEGSKRSHPSSPASPTVAAIKRPKTVPADSEELAAPEPVQLAIPAEDRTTTPPPEKSTSQKAEAEKKEAPGSDNEKKKQAKMSDLSDIEYEDSTGGYEDDEDADMYDSDGGSADEDVSGFDMIDQVSNLKEKQKAYEIDYIVLSEAELTRRQNDEIQQVAGIVGIKEADAALLLRHFNWNKDVLIEKYMDSATKVFEAVGLKRSEGPRSPRIGRARGFVCDVCFDDSCEETIALPCAHRFCKPCYTQYIESKVLEGESRNIQCMAGKCTKIVDEYTVQALVDSEMWARYRVLLNRTFVDDNPALRFCPAPNCEFAIECHVSKKSLDTIVPSVNCQCGYRFCFGCALADHQPCICPIVKLWLKKCEDDSETANWISANTKECTKCHSTIEKNGGCNHMTCKKCKHEFCWVCLGIWSDHGTSWYNCNRYEEKADVGKDQQSKSRASLERYLHYYNRFANHEQSLKLDKDLYIKTERKMQEMQESSDLSWIEVQFLKKAVDTLSVCRTTLKWTYAMAYYLERNNFTELFEDNQRDLEQAVEDLSGMLEEPIEADTISELRQKVTDKTVYVHKRNEIMLEETARDYQEGRVRWQVSYAL